MHSRTVHHTKQASPHGARLRHGCKTVALLCLALGLIACDERPETTGPARRAAPPPHRVESREVRLETVRIEQHLASHFQARRRVRLHNEEAQRITAMPFRIGDRVNAGDTLVHLDRRQIETEVEKAGATLTQARADLDRLMRLQEKNLSTADDITRARTTVTRARADLDRQRIRLDATRIRSPIDGVVTERRFEPGDVPAAASHLMTVIDPRRLYAVVTISEHLLPLLQPGQNVEVSIDALGANRHPATVTRIHPTIDDWHKGRFEITLDPLPAGAKAGQFIRVHLQLQAGQRLLIPTRCIQMEPAGAYVYRIVTGDDGNGRSRVEKTPFEKGPTFGDKTVVIHGLQAGDRLVSKGFLGLRDGKPVEVVD